MTWVGSLRFTMSSSVIMSAGSRVPRGTGVMGISQSLVSKAHDGPLYRLNHAYDAMLRRCPRGIVRAPDNGLLGKTIQPGLTHIEHAPPAHTYVNELSQVCRGRSW